VALGSWVERVVVVGAGLGGLSCALHLAGAGRQVTVLEREPAPGGHAGRLSIEGYRFDSGPTVLTMPELLAETLNAVGEELTDWLELTRLDPAYRAHYPDGSTLDVVADTVRMAAEVARVCGPREADGYLRFVDYARGLWRLERDDFVARNLDSPRDLLTANLLRLLAAGGFRRLATKVGQFFADPRTRRIFFFPVLVRRRRTARRPRPLRGHRLPGHGRRGLLPAWGRSRGASCVGRGRGEARRADPVQHGSVSGGDERRPGDRGADRHR
jgi:phytoene desaturase